MTTAFLVLLTLTVGLFFIAQMQEDKWGMAYPLCLGFSILAAVGALYTAPFAFFAINATKAEESAREWALAMHLEVAAASCPQGHAFTSACTVTIRNANANGVALALISLDCDETSCKLHRPEDAVTFIPVVVPVGR